MTSLDVAQIAESLSGMRQALNADGYELDVDVNGERVTVSVRADESACPDCLVPKALMLDMISSAAHLQPGQIALTYPADSGGDAHH